MASNRFSRADVLYRSIIRNTFFSQGWGSIEMYRNLQRLKQDMFNAEKFKEMVSVGESVKIEKVDVVKSKSESYSVLDGHFVSPLVKYYPGLLPKESEVARFQAVIPSNRFASRQAMCIQLAGTGDHRYWRRRNLMAKPLVRENSIGSVLLVNPYYGCRKPKTQTRSSLNCVVDLFVMGCALIVETSVLLNWCQDQGFGPLAVTGVSMGGHMASLAATFVPKPIAVVPCLSWTTASTVFTEGVLSNAVAWSVLEKQLEDSNFIKELWDICHHIETDGWHARSCSTTSQKPDYLSSFPDELHHVINSNRNLAVQPSCDFHVNISNKGPGIEDCESVSVTMLAASYKEQLENNFRHNVVAAIPLLKSRLPRSDSSQRYEKAKKFMKYILDITTHLAYYKKPVAPQLAVFVQAMFDGYIPRNDCGSPLDLWSGCGVKYTDCGHIFAALYKQDLFRKTIAETLDKVA